MIINQEATKTSLAQAREIFGEERFISPEEVWEKFDVPGISDLSKDSYICAFNFLHPPFSRTELESRKEHAYLVPIHCFALADMHRLLIHDERLSFGYKADEIREQLEFIKPLKPSWKIIDENPGLTKKSKCSKPRLSTLLQAALIIQKTRNVNILAKGSICYDSVRYKEKNVNPVLFAKMEKSAFRVESFLNLSDVKGPEFVISID